MGGVEPDAVDRPLGAPPATPWLALCLLGLSLVAIVLDLHWVWGLFLLTASLHGIQTGVTHLGEPVARVDHPVLFWVLVGLWTLCGVETVISPLWPWLDR